MFSKKPQKLTKYLLSIWQCIRNKCQIDSEDFVKFCGLLRKHEFYEDSGYYYWKNSKSVWFLEHSRLKATLSPWSSSCKIEAQIIVNQT